MLNVPVHYADDRLNTEKSTVWTPAFARVTVYFRCPLSIQIEIKLRVFLVAFHGSDCL